jgi:hypothetical protein
MSLEIFQTTAENVVGATDAALQKPAGVDDALVAAFLDTTSTYAGDAPRMACELSLVKEVRPGLFCPGTACSVYLCTAVRESKAAILRFVLEQYEAYRTFKSRLALSGIVGEAATQTKALHGISAHREIIASTFIDLGTYSQSIVSEGSGLYRPRLDDAKEYLTVLDCC